MISFLNFLLENTVTKTTNKTYALIGGSFKPPTVGHLDMVKKYSKMADIVIVLISVPSKKSQRKTKLGSVITPEMSKDIWNIYIKAAKLSNVKIDISSKPSPIAACYDWINDLAPENSNIILGASSKDNDFTRWLKAPEYFAKTRPDLNILDPKTTAVKPYVSKNNIPVSASEIRNNIDNDEYILNLLPSELSTNEKNKVISILRKNTIKNTNESLITEGGASGHMTNLFEDSELTFEDLKDIFKQIFSGSIEITEKTDGIALAVTVKDGVLKAARNKSTLKNPLSIDELDSMFSDRPPNIRKAFVNSMKAINKAINYLSTDELQQIFNNGQNFMAFEIIDPEARNILNYGDQLIIQLHGVNKYDNKFNKIGEDKDAAKLLYNILKKYNVLNIDNYKISGPQILKIKQSKSFKQSLDKILNKIDNIERSTNTKNLEDYTNKKYIQYVISLFKENNLKYNNDLILSIVNKYNNLSTAKSTVTKIKTLAKQMNYNEAEKNLFVQVLKQIESEAFNKNAEIISPIQDIVIEAGILLLQNVNGFISMNPDKTSQELTKNIEQTIQLYKETPEIFNDNKKKIFEKNIKKLINWQKNISPAEGVVFIYKNKVYKMTGQFGPINQIVNLLRY